MAWNRFAPRPADSSGWEKRLGYLSPDDSLYDPFWRDPAPAPESGSGESEDAM